MSAMDAVAVAAIALSPLAVLGWTGNACYFSRFLVQWLMSERARRSVSPTIFWWLSLGGAAALGTYTFFDGDRPLLFGYVLTFFIYLRNISIAHLGPRAGRLGPAPAMGLAVLLAGALIWFGALPSDETRLPLHWVVVAFAGQAIFSSRFIVQWYHSERTGDAHFPRVFWWLSLVGNTALLAYAVRKGDPVFIAGFLLGPFVQVRNLMLLARADAEEARAASSGAA